MKQEKVINSPATAFACARVDCVQYSTQTSTQSGFIDKPICSQTTRARTREGLTPLRNPKAYFDAWRSATVGDSTDYLRIAVNEAVEAFSSDKSAEAQESDRRIWLKIANPSHSLRSLGRGKPRGSGEADCLFNTWSRPRSKH